MTEPRASAYVTYVMQDTCRRIVNVPYPLWPIYIFVDSSLTLSFNLFVCTLHLRCKLGLRAGIIRSPLFVLFKVTLCDSVTGQT